MSTATSTTCSSWTGAEDAMELPWHAMIDLMTPHVVQIMTPRGVGTGFLLFKSSQAGFVAVATAAHVVSAAHYWEEPIRIQHHESGKTVLARAADRAVLVNVPDDVAAVMFSPEDMPLPEATLPLSSKEIHVKVGIDIGWLGFPAISTELCFFSGRVSAYQHARQRYLVDGVAISGVSGGPAFKSEEGIGLSVMGVVSAYIPNTATGQALPGLSVVTDVVEFHNMVAGFRSIEDAQEKQTPPNEVPAGPLVKP